MKDDFLNSKIHYLHPNRANQQHSVVTDYRDPNISTTTEYIPTLKQTGYIIGDPIHSPNNQRSNTPTLQINSPTHPPNVKFDFHSPNRDRSVSRVINGGESLNNSRINLSKTVNYTPPSQVSNYQPIAHHQEMVPQKQYEKCISQCKVWESKFNQLYKEYVKMKQRTSAGDNEEENIFLKNQNMELRARIHELESKQKRVYDDLERNFVKLVNKYKDSTLKECLLLTDRYRLEKKHTQRY